MDHTKTETETFVADEPEKLPISTVTEEEVTPKEEAATSKMDDTTPKEEAATSKMEDHASKVDVPKVQTDSDSEEEDGEKLLDLAFAMDCTGSMGSQIHAAKEVGYIF